MTTVLLISVIKGFILVFSLPTLADGETIDTSQMPYVGNGHIATTIYNESMHMNGIYTGERSKLVDEAMSVIRNKEAIYRHSQECIDR